TDRTGRRLVGQGSASQQGLRQGELEISGVSRGPNQERAILIRPRDVVDDAELRTHFRGFRETSLPGDGVIDGDDRKFGAGQAERAALDAVIEGRGVVSPKDAGCEGGVEVGEGRGDLSFEECRVVHRLQGTGTQGAGYARARPRIQGGRLEATDRDA